MAGATQAPSLGGAGEEQRAQSWTERARSLRTLADAEILAADLATRGALARSEPGFAAAWSGRTHALFFETLDQRTDASVVERSVALARAAQLEFGNVDARLRVELEFAGWQIESGRAGAAESTLARAESLRLGAPRLAPDLDYLHAVLARRTGDLDAVTRAHDAAVTALAHWLEVDAETPETRVTWLAYHGELAARVESELGRARLDAGLPDLAAQAFAREGAFAAAIPSTAIDAHAAARALHAQDELWLALGTERFELALTCCAKALDGSLQLEPAERTTFEIGRAVALSEAARGRPDTIAEPRAELERLARAQRAGELHIDASQRAAVELARADIELRARDWVAVREALAAAGVAIDSARGVEHETWPTRFRASAAALASRLALETHAAPQELAHARDVLRERFSAIVASWEKRALRPGGVGFLYWGTQRLVLSELISAEVALAPGAEGATAALDHLVRAQRVGTLARSLLGAWAPDWNAVRDELAGADGGWIVLFPAMDRSHLFLVEGARVEHVELPSRDALAAASQALRSSLQRAPPSDPARAHERGRELEQRASELTALVLRGPAIERLREWPRVRVTGAELCQGLPFECLRLDGQWLGCARAVSHVPSLPVAAALARRAHARGQPATPPAYDFVLLAEPALAETTTEKWREQTSFPLTPEDAAALTEPFVAGRSLILRGTSASTDALASPAAAGCTVLGLLTHGVLAVEHERSARLLLAPGAEDSGELDGDRIDALERTPPCVLLCACGSAGGPQRLGDDTGAHLAAAFQRRGTDVVLVSRGDVSYRATVQLTAAFLRAMSDGAAPDEALRSARAELAGTESFADPYYFGLVSLSGIGDRRTFALPPRPRDRQVALFVGVAAALGLALAFGLRRASRIRRAQMGSIHHAQ